PVKTDPLNGTPVSDYGGAYTLAAGPSGITTIAVYGDQISAEVPSPNAGGNVVRQGTIEVKDGFPGSAFAGTDGGDFVFEGRLWVAVTNQFGFPDLDYYAGIFSYSQGQFKLRVLRFSEE